MQEKRKVRFRLSAEDSGIAYIELQDHPGRGTQGCVWRTVRLNDLLDYVGPRIHLDLDSDNHLIGIEIIDNVDQAGG